MDADKHDKGEAKEWQSAHVCPQCGHAVALKDIGLMERSMGLITCPQCNWSGPVDIAVVEQKPE